MDFKDQLKVISDRVTKLKEQISTEEATKNAFIMPFLQALGYDVFNPIEVVPEFVSDIGLKKGEKIDYAIFKDGSPTILIECKHWAQNLNIHDGQLLRYFHVSKAKFGLLTNGITYRFYSDLVEPNKMDEKPFLEFNIHEIKDRIENMPKHYQIEVGKLLIHQHKINYNDNQNGIFINLSHLTPEVIEKMSKFIEYVDLQEKQLEIDEKEKEIIEEE
jgi:hypothetical protein